MKNLQKSRKGSALLIGLIVTVFLSILVIGFMEKVLKVGQNAKAIEQSTAAYYLASGKIENKLGDLWQKIKTAPWNIQSDAPLLAGFSGTYLLAQTKSNKIPADWKGNSPFDVSKEWNLMSLNDPVQIVIPKGVDWTQVKLFFRVPNTTGKESEKWEVHDDFQTGSGIILWTFGNATKVLYANPNEVLKKDEINGTEKYLKYKKWYYYEANGVKKDISIKDFYSNLDDWCGTTNTEYECTLKLSMISPIIARIWWQKIENFPYLEYKIEFPPTTQIPEQFMTLDSSGYVDKYFRKRPVQIPQITTNTALDFAVLQ